MSDENRDPGGRARSGPKKQQAGAEGQARTDRAQEGVVPARSTAHGTAHHETVHLFIRNGLDPIIPMTISCEATSFPRGVDRPCIISP